MKLSRAAQRFTFVAVLAALLLLGGLLAWIAAHAQNARATQTHAQALAERQATSAHYLKAQADEPAIRRAVVRFQALQREGVAGTERRLDWIEALDQLRSQRQLPSLQFELAPQRAPLPDTPELRASSLKLQVQLSHELELLPLLDALRAVRGVRVLPRQCALERMEATPTSAGVGVKTSCELDWITLGASPTTTP